MAATVGSLPGCGAETEQTPPAALDAGSEPSCPAGEILQEDGSCVRAGIPAASCAAGFVAEDDGCTPLLPTQPCSAGLMAVPGETECREVAPCGTAPWGDIPVEAGTQYVDAAYAGADSDGSAGRPWTTITEGIEAAAAGAIVAVAEGSYAEYVHLLGKPVRLWGRCPALVEIAAPADAFSGIDIEQHADGTEIHTVAIRGYTQGLTVSGSENVVVDRVWLHDLNNRGLDLEDTLGPTSALIRGVLVEHVTMVGLFVASVPVVVEDTVVRDVQPDSTGHFGRGAAIQGSPPFAVPASAVIRRSVFERNHEVGIAIEGSDVTLEATVVRDHVPQPADGDFGRGINVRTATAHLSGCVVSGNTELGINVAAGGSAAIAATVVRDTLSQPQTGYRGGALGVQDSQLLVRDCLLDGNRAFGVAVVDGTAGVETTLIRDTETGQSGHLGDGVVTATFVTPASATVANSWVGQSARAGIASFGAAVELGTSRLWCNAVDLDGELHLGHDFHFSDRGGNGCGCEAQPRVCTVQTANLDPPSALE